MSERDRYEPGVPCWVDHSSNDPAAVVDFYRGLFAWDVADQQAPGAPGPYYVCRLRDRVVAGIGTEMLPDASPAWNTYVAVESADVSAARVQAAGGAVVAGPFDVPETGRCAYVTDAEGASFALWQAGRHVGAELVNEPGALCWNEFATRDVPSATRFYGEVFGWIAAPTDFGGVEYLILQLGDGPEPADAPDETSAASAERALGGMMPMVGDAWPAEAQPHWMTYFAVQDTDGIAARAESLGGRVAVAGFDTPAGRIAVLEDPLGVAFSIIQMPNPEI